MSLSKIIIAFLIVLVIFAGVIFFQFAKGPAPTGKVTVKERTFNVFIQRTPEELQKGLSGRNSLGNDQGMLFLFEQPGDLTFWMKDMKFPIDIIFINGNRIVSISENAQPPKSPEETLPLYKATAPADKVLEINAGLSKEYGLKPGDTLSFDIPQEEK